MKKTLLATAIILAVAATPTAFAKGKPTPGGEAGNNLSVATVFVPGLTQAPTLRMACLPVRQPPTGPRCIDYPLYYCQKTEALWQAVCTTAATGTVTVNAVWGANLTGDAPLKAGRPIRVEMVLNQVGATVTEPNGYKVEKLTPELEDRYATYGTTDTAASNLQTQPTVFDAGARLKIQKCLTSECTTFEQFAIFDNIVSAEINSTGNVVYGYNWGTAGKTGAATPGFYKLTFTGNNTDIVSSPTPATVCADENCVYVIIEVTQSGGGGGPPNRP